MTKRGLRAAALDRIFERALLVGSATLLTGCCGFLSRMAPAQSGFTLVNVSVAKDPRLRALVRAGYTEALDTEICDSYCGSHGIEACSLGKLEVELPERVPQVRCRYTTGADELRSLPVSTATAGVSQAPDCNYVCGYPGREVRSCASVAAVAETDVILCRFYHPARCVTHIPSGRPPAGLRLEHLPAVTTPSRYFAVAAYLEAASALAFDDLALQLIRHRAPSGLIQRCRRAARDERFHERALAGFARTDFASLPPAEPPPRAEPGLCELALENVAQGCVIETYSALVMAYQARHAEDPELRCLLARIARDERRHALLSWDILAWTQRRLSGAEQGLLGEQVRRARAHLEASLPQFSRELQAELGLPEVRVAKAMLRSLDAELWRAGEGLSSGDAPTAALAQGERAQRGATQALVEGAL